MTGTIDGDAEHDLLTSIMAQMVRTDGRVVGAAFAVAPDLLVTSAHVVAGADRLVPLGAGPVAFEVVAAFGEVDDVMPKLAPWPDLAVLRVTEHRFVQWAVPSDRLPDFPADVRMAGFPRAGGAANLSILTVGIDSMGGSHPARILRLVGAQVEGGASGGPLIDPVRRAVVGVVLASKDPKQAHGGFAVAISELRTRWQPGAIPSPPRDDGPWLHAYPTAMRAGFRPTIVHLPKRSNAPHFVRRPALVDRLEHAGDEPTVIRALGGSGGVGKSELALYWARRCAEDGQHSVVWWVDATTEASTHAGLVALANALGVEPGADLATTSARVDVALARLDRRWMAVLDNADSLDHLVDNLPTAPGGMTIVTTRSTTAGADIDAVEISVDVFDEDEAVGFLLDAVGAVGPAPAAVSIADRLGYLPLALAQAAAFMNQESMSLAAYDALISDDLPTGLEVSAARHERTVASLWDHIWPLLSDATLAALARASLLAPKAIPVEALETDSMSAGEVARALRQAARYRVVTITDGPAGIDTVDMHQLTQVAAMPTGDDLGRAVDALLDRLTALGQEFEPTRPDSWPTWGRLATHIAHLYSLRQVPRSDALLIVADYLAHYWHARGMSSEVLGLMEGIWLDLSRRHGQKHPATLTSRSNLAVGYREAGRVAEAIAANEEVLSARRLTLGEDHPDTISTLNNLASCLGDTGRIDEAIELQKEVIAARVKSGGKDHPLALTATSNLANSYWRAGRVDEAVALEEDVLRTRARVLGDEHPDTLTARSHLAISLRQGNRLDEAIELLRSVLEARRRVLGHDHPDTLTSIGNLALALRQAGAVDEATSLLTAAARAADRALGPEHPRARALARELARWSDGSPDRIDP